MNRTPHEMILASAGSGKTYELTNRFVALLAAGAAPDRIVALTFTRKAAGEFFDEILRKLARAAAEPGFARQLDGQLAEAGFGAGRHLEPADFLQLLRAMVEAMHRLRLGTLDSFFARVAKSFPLELGLDGDFEILQEHTAQLERRRVLRGMFARSGDRLEAAQAEFVEAFKRATFGAEEKRLSALLDRFLDEYQDNFLAAPDPTVWGNPARIWTGGAPWFGAEVKLADEVRTLRAELGALTDGQRARWEAFFAALAEWMPGAPLPKPLEYLLKNTLEAWDDLCDGKAVITVERRKLALTPGACRALRRIVTHLIGAVLRRHIETTRGIFAVLRGYEENYHDLVRRAGRLTFADIQRLLAPAILTRQAPGTGELVGEDDAAEADSDADSGQMEFSLGARRRPERSAPPSGADEATRLLLDYRLDAEIDHWLLDEFQDTSFGQWSVLRNLIDEVVQDPEGRRSFFCVGDVKQAIYSWREGDPRLFREIFAHYNTAAPGSIAERHLVASWRSGPPLIEMVNAVFGNGATLAELFPGEASTTWNREWREHRSAVPERTGQAAWLHAADAGERWETTRRLLEEIRPLERGLSCAVLVRKNDTAATLADYLRRAGMAAIAESDLHIATDNPLGTALLALFQAAAHPGDTFAREHVRMTPLGAVLDSRGLGTPEALTREVLAQVHGGGFERTVEGWIAALEPSLAADDAFSRMRARQFAAAAGLFDATGNRDIGEFIAFMERHTVRPSESAAVIRVMTIHKSKGLGFDVVVLPDLEGNRIDERRDGLAVQKAADRSVDWVLDLPPRMFCLQDKVLAAHIRAAEADACYESLSLLYVALTRAKRAMYVVTEPPGASKSRNFPRLLAATLGEEATDVRVGDATLTGVWSSGDPDWHRALAPAAAAPTGAAAELPALSPAAAAARRIARRPSAPTGPTTLGALFGLEGAAAREFGTALHHLLAQVEWAGPSDVARRIAAWRTEGAETAATAAAEACVRAPGLAAVWRRPNERAEVWRERSFEIVLDDAWVTGVFDRVVVERDETGRPTAATVFDFKTDRVVGADEIAPAVARHAAQLNTYRRVAAVLTGLPVAAVTCELVFTHPGMTVPVPLAEG